MNRFQQFGSVQDNYELYLKWGKEEDDTEYKEQFYAKDLAVYHAFEAFIHTLQERRHGIAKDMQFEKGFIGYGESFTEEAMAQLYEVLRAETCRWLDTIQSVRKIMKPKWRISYTDTKGVYHKDKGENEAAKREALDWESSYFNPNTQGKLINYYNKK